MRPQCLQAVPLKHHVLRFWAAITRITEPNRGFKFGLKPRNSEDESAQLDPKLARTPEEYLTIDELSNRLKIQPKTIKNKMAAGIFQKGIHYFSRT